MHEERIAGAILCILLFASFSVVFASVTDTAYAQAPQTITPTITLVSSPCDSDTAPSPCLVATSTSIKFAISFDSITLNRTTFETADVVWVGNSEGGNLHDEYGAFAYRIFVYDDDTVTLKIPAGSVSDTSGNTNSAAEITIRADFTPPTVQIPSEYLRPDDAYRQFVQIKQPYIAPEVTCIDEVYEGDTLSSTQIYDVVADKVVSTNVEPDDLPRIINVKYSCHDEAQREGVEYLKVHLVEDLAVFNMPPTVTSIDRSDPSTENTDSQSLVYRVLFSKEVTGVDTRDFVLSPTSTGGRENNPDGTPDPFMQTRSPLLSIPYNQTVSDTITVPDSGIATSVSVAVKISHAYPVDLKVDLIAPDGTVRTLHDSSGSGTINIDRTYNPSFDSMPATGVWTLNVSDSIRPVSGTLNSWTLTINYGPPFPPTIADVTGQIDTYYVTVPAITGGTYNLDLVSSGHGIVDIAGKSLTNIVPTSGTDQTYTVNITDSTAPTLESIKRSSPAEQDTDSRTLIYEITFSEDVTGVDAADFALSPDSPSNTTAANPVTGISGSGDVYYVTVSASTDGAYNLDLVSSGHGIKDAAENHLTDTAPTTGTDQTYNVSTTVADDTAPTLESIKRSSPAEQDTDSRTLIYEITFSEDVTGVDAADFVLSPDSPGNTTAANPVTGISGSGDVYYVTVSASTDGAYNLDLVSSGHGIEDTAENPLTDTAPTTGTDQTYNVSTTVADDTAPTLESIKRSSPAEQDTDSRTLIYEITFSEDVTGVDAADFVLSPGSPGNTTAANPVTGISGSGDVYYVTVSASTDGAYNLDLVSSGHGIEDTAENHLTDTAPTTGTDHTYDVGPIVIDNTAPTLESIKRSSPAEQDTDSRTLIYKITFSEDVTGVDAADFVLSPGSPGNTTVANPVTGISGSGDVYYVTVSASTDGAYNLDLVSSGHGIKDAAENHLTDTASTTGTDQTYNVSTTVADDTAPTLESIKRSSPAEQDTDSRTLIYEITFSEDVTGVDTNDFVLSPESTGSGSNITTTVSGQFTQTRSLSLAIPYNQTVSDAITVPDSGIATSVSVAVNITHAYPVDLKVDLIAPGGMLVTLHDREGGDDVNIVRTYTPSLDGVSVAGVWTLKIHDDFELDSGTLNNWTLAINHSTTTITALSPVTGISGSGGVYNVTVSASTDGKYNLDLVSSGHGIEDTAENPLTDTAPSTGTDHTYDVGPIVIDNTAPTLESILRHSPETRNTDSQTLVYKVIFSEDVTGVDAADFVLSPESAGGGVGNATVTGSEQFTQTRSPSPSLAIPYNQTVSDTITVPDSGNAISVSVAVNITHAYPEDLKVDLIAPDGTLVTLHDPEVGGDVNIVRTYTPSLGGVSIAGVWTLKMHDDLEPDSGTLNSWTLTINHGALIVSTDVGPVTGISGSGGVYNVTVSASTVGAYNLDLVSSGHGIEDTAENPLTDTAPTTGTDQTYTVSAAGMVDNTAPALVSIERSDPAAEYTDVQTLVYKVTFSETVKGVSASDFVLSPESPGNTTATDPVVLLVGYYDVYNVTVSAPTVGTYNLDLVSSGHGIEDTAENPLTDTVPTTGTDQTYTVGAITDNTAPALESIMRYSPATTDTDSLTLIYNVTFSEDVTGVDVADFVLSPGSTGSGGTTTTTVSGQFTQTRLPSFPIIDNYAASDPITVPDSGTATSVSVAVDISHTYIGDLKVDLIAPDGTVRTLHDRSGGGTDNIVKTYTPDFDGTQIQGVWELRISDLATRDTGALDSWTLTINHGTTTTTALNPVTGISGSGDAYYVTVSASSDGTYNLDLVSSVHGIEDTAENPLTDTVPTTGTDQTYTVGAITDNTAPALESIQRHSPATPSTASQTLVYKVTFSEDVTGVDAGDFALSPGSAGSGGTATAAAVPGQFTQTRSPSLAITDFQTVSDAITVPDSGNVTSVSVAVDISHTHIGDLKVVLIAPDGTAKTLHNRSGGSIPDIVGTYTPDFDGAQVQGVWTLRISDHANSDIGILDSWTLAVDYDAAAGTLPAGPVTDISGSGDAYYVTVYASSDGTYNLDLVSSGHGIEDAAENPLADTAPATGIDQTYTVSADT